MPESASRFRFRSRGVPDGLKVSHPIFEQKIEDILSLGDHDAVFMKMSTVCKFMLNVLQVNISSQDAFSNEVVVHLDVLCPSMEDKVFGKLNTPHVVTITRNSVGDLNM